METTFPFARPPPLKATDEKVNPHDQKRKLVVPKGKEIKAWGVLVPTPTLPVLPCTPRSPKR